MKVFVTGAAGFIGSIVTEVLLDNGCEVTAFDSLSNGHQEAVDERARFIKGDLLDFDVLSDAVAAADAEVVVHLAAEALIDESIRDPGRFFHANVTGGINLLEAMKRSGLERIVFSSTAAVFGEPKAIPIDESHPQVPVNAYGESKLQFERIMAWYRRSFGLRNISLRYFNACGASVTRGERREKETHIIPLLLDAAAGKRSAFRLFGTDYETPDGTCVRDYVHVLDIAGAHLLAIAQIDEIGSGAFNLGSGHGHTNREVIAAVERVTGNPVPVINDARRSGDPARLVASNDLAKRVLGWNPKHGDLDGMIADAWHFRRRMHAEVAS